MYKRQIVALGAVAGLAVAMTLAPAAQATPMQGGKVTVTDGGPTITALPLPAGETSGDILSATSQWAVGLVADDAQVQHVAVWRRQAAGVWSVNDLGDLGFSEPSSGLSATGVNSRGQVAIGINTEVGMGGWLYYRGVFHRLADFAGGKNAFARAINASGEVVGEALDAQGNDYAAVWRDWWSAPVRLAPTTGMDGSFAQGVNSHGNVAGGSFSNGPAPTRAVVWGRHGTPRILRDLGAGGDAADINTRGRTVGRVYGSVDSEAAVWDQGTVAQPRSLLRRHLLQGHRGGRDRRGCRVRRHPAELGDPVAPTGVLAGLRAHPVAPPARSQLERQRLRARDRRRHGVRDQHGIARNSGTPHRVDPGTRTIVRSRGHEQHWASHGTTRGVRDKRRSIGGGSR